MQTDERRKAILQLLEEQNSISVAILSKKFSVSPVTIRKDLEALEKSLMVTRTRGGVILAKAAPAPPFISRAELHFEEKMLIAKTAAEMVEDDDSILLDSGTTTLAIARQLLNRQKLTVVTNSLPIAYTFGNSNVNVMLTGGTLLGTQMSLIGPETEEYLSRIQVNKLFLGASGVRGTMGLTTSSSLEAQVKRQMIKVAKKVILVADHSKFNSTSIVLFADFKQIDCVITTQPLDDSFLQHFNKLGIEVIYATK
ncbi:DeoR/GlpR family DNA-binding transcription regulator [Moorella naiadis]|uniref:DeoR/GlpR family DNA-binding transcription regulator n=1 Tax=Moorella naiadis (nom. illeg.) TaxID=3093670 RepID=UPI003D9C94F7